MQIPVAQVQLGCLTKDVEHNLGGCMVSRIYINNAIKEPTHGY